jgi:4-amino-4-deoxy-L-arabinose transferase-like glycosyltransferase
MEAEGLSMDDKARRLEKLRQMFLSVGFIVVVAFAVRTAFVTYIFLVDIQRTVRDNLPFGFEAGAVAAAIAQGRGFSSPLRSVQTGPTAWFTPIYPYLLAGIFKLFGVYSYASDILIRLLDGAFSACTCWPIQAIGAKAFGKRTGTAAAWIWAIFPLSLYFSTVWVWDTALSALMLALIVAATLNLRGSERLRSWIGYGALWAVGAMVNPGLVSVLPALALWAIWPLRRRFANAGKLAVASSLIFTAGIMPWTIRNYVVFHKLIPFRSNFGLELWLGNNPGVPESWSPWLHPNDDPSEASKYARMTEIPYMQEKQQEAIDFMRSHPGDTLNFILHRFSNNWLGMDQSPLDVWSHAPLEVRLIVLGNCLFPLFSLLGLLVAYRQQNEAALPLALVVLFFPVVFYITHASTRYRHPMDPIMLVLAVYGLVYAVTYLRRRLSGLESRIPLSHTTD